MLDNVHYWVYNDGIITRVEVFMRWLNLIYLPLAILCVVRCWCLKGVRAVSRWLSKTERDKRDVIVVRLYSEGVIVSQIAARFRRDTNWVYERLKVMGVKANRAGGGVVKHG